MQIYLYRCLSKPGDWLPSVFDGPIVEPIGFEIQGPRRDLLERKFERESLGIELFLPATADRADIEFGGFVQTGPGSEQPGF